MEAALLAAVVHSMSSFSSSSSSRNVVLLFVVMVEVGLLVVVVVVVEVQVEVLICDIPDEKEGEEVAESDVLGPKCHHIYYATGTHNQISEVIKE